MRTQRKTNGRDTRTIDGRTHACARHTMTDRPPPLSPPPVPSDSRHRRQAPSLPLPSAQRPSGDRMTSETGYHRSHERPCRRQPIIITTTMKTTMIMYNTCWVEKKKKKINDNLPTPQTLPGNITIYCHFFPATHHVHHTLFSTRRHAIPKPDLRHRPPRFR